MCRDFAEQEFFPFHFQFWDRRAGMRSVRIGADGLLAVLLLLLGHTCLGLQVTAPLSQTVSLHSRVVLPCSFTVNSPLINPKFLAIIWSFGTEELLRFDSKEKVASDGVAFDEQAASQGDASLTVRNSTVARHGTYRCFVIYSPDRLFKEIQLNVQASPTVKIQKKTLLLNEENQVDCSISGFFPKDIRVTWLRNNIRLQESTMTELQVEADGTFRTRSWIDLIPGDIPERLHITCQVEHVSRQEPIQDGYYFMYRMAPQVQLIASRTLDGNEQFYTCEAKGFTPQALSIDWLVDGKMADPPKESENGIFNKQIYYRINLQENRIPAEVSCKVQHEALNSPVTKTLQVQSFNECKRNCHSGLFAIPIAFLIIAVGLLWYCKKYLTQFQVSPLYKEHVWENKEKIHIYCMAFKCPEKVKVFWTVNDGDQNEIEIPESQIYKDDESGPLMKHRYTVKTFHKEDKSLHNATTVLSFNTTMTSHKKTLVKCEILCGRKWKKRTLDFVITNRKPLVKEPIKVSLDDSEDVVCSLALEYFYPGDIQVQWNYMHLHDKELQSTKVINNDQDCTYKCNSICRIPRQDFLDPGFKVRVTWKHDSLDQPGSLELSLQDILWRPVMEDIIVPSLFNGKEAKLQCVIKGHLLKDLEVKWLWREGGELYEVCPGDKYKIPMLEVTRDSDNTYKITSSLIVTVSVKAEHKSEFICRVTHKSLKTPLEKSTGELTVKGVPDVTLKNVDTTRVHISHFFPKKINITWSREKNGKFEAYKSNDFDVSEQSYENDGTYTCTSSLKSIKKNKRCKIRVEHESMAKPIEKCFVKNEKGKLEEVSNTAEIQDDEELDTTAPALEGGEGSKKKKKRFSLKKAS